MNPLLAYTLYKIMNTPIRAWPFPHIVVDDVIEPYFYERLVANWPKEEEFKPFQDYEDRFEAPLPDVTAWDLFRHAFCTGNFAAHMLTLFDIKWAKPSTDLRIFWDKPGYRIGPHPDVPNKLVTCLFYLPQPPQIYHDNGTVLMLNRETDITKVAFKANRLVAFAVSQDSWHRVHPGPEPRTSAQLFVVKELPDA